MKLEVERLLAAGQFAEAKPVLQKALSADPDSATLLALQRQAAERLEHAVSRQREAKLLPEIEVENGVRVDNTGAKSKAQMKRERQRRKQKE